MNLQRPGDAQALERGLLDIRSDQNQLLELVALFLEECGTQNAGGLLPAVCGWLTGTSLREAAAEAQQHARNHLDCETADELLQHAALRDATNGAPPVLHIVFPEAVTRSWQNRWPLRTDHPTWRRPTIPAPTAIVGGATDSLCPRCRGVVESLLILPATAAYSISSRPSVQFAWCACCTPFTEATFARVDATGRAELIKPTTIIELDPYPAPAPFSSTDVELIDLGPEWRTQDWMWSNGVENLQRVGGLPTWIQNADTAECPQCKTAMPFVAQVAVEDLGYDEGITYLHWCDDCAVTAVIYQQT